LTNREAAGRDIRRASIILDEARILQERAAWSLAVRRAQEAVEIALKGALRWAGIEVPRLHDVGFLLRQNPGRFPPEFTALVPRLASISRSLRAERERSFYGDEETGLPPEELYSEEDGDEAIQKAGFVLKACMALVSLEEQR